MIGGASFDCHHLSLPVLFSLSLSLRAPEYESTPLFRINLFIRKGLSLVPSGYPPWCDVKQLVKNWIVPVALFRDSAYSSEYGGIQFVCKCRVFSIYKDIICIMSHLCSNLLLSNHVREFCQSFDYDSNNNDHDNERGLGMTINNCPMWTETNRQYLPELLLAPKPFRKFEKALL